MLIINSIYRCSAAQGSVLDYNGLDSEHEGKKIKLGLLDAYRYEIGFLL